VGESPAAGDTEWDLETAAAMGRENKETKRDEDALRRVEANSLAVVGSRVVLGWCRRWRWEGGGRAAYMRGAG